MSLCECGCGEQTKVATRSDTVRGTIKGQSRRFIAGHQRRCTDPPYREIDCGYETRCWIWQLHVAGHGYGQITSGRGSSRLAHRVYWERRYGPVDQGLELDHLCRNRACVNPEHLEAVTHVENLRRGSHTKLSVDDVRFIRASAEDALALAQRFNVARNTIYAVRSRKNWKDVA